MNNTKITDCNDLTIGVAIGDNRKSRMWRNTQMRWPEFVHKCSRTHRTDETYAEYMELTKAHQDEIKDVGGFLCATLLGTRRGKEAVLSRPALTLDGDFAKYELWEDFQMTFGCTSLMYTTHKHSFDNPRIRIIAPFSRAVKAEEYVPISRKVCQLVDIEQFDHTTHDVNRLMYWPSTSKDGEFLFDKLDGPLLDPDQILKMYNNWQDASEWPVSVRECKNIKAGITKQADPLEKTGLIGAFCRRYTITEAIEKFLPHVYEPCDVEDRWTYKGASTYGGLVVYGDTMTIRFIKISRGRSKPASTNTRRQWTSTRRRSINWKKDGQKNGKRTSSTVKQSGNLQVQVPRPAL